ncbi:TonB-dependent receptor [Flavivirga rizhaonensis]|uniref:TonB-dependent receptor n=1 Tax=Flavivirga rizhaonensis TaxID=2559571 RepID=A0A4S1DU74_9FLAO|nr:TonB-dependent receptor [Flavivirga rizhaonensis]TGV00962.1 TonB-dependent receptor [Flavivirga rizhaonensis]
MKIFLLILLSILLIHSAKAQSDTYELSFKVKNQNTNENLEDTQIYITPCNCGGVTNIDGSFAINLPKGEYNLSITYIGFKSHNQKILLDKNILIEVALEEAQEQLSKIILRAKKANDNIDRPQMGAIQLEAEEIKKLPSALGEIDVLKGVTLLAGVNNAGDVSNGLSVRGGSLDQNLILYDYAPVFNPTHLFGLFSVFTPDVLSSIDLYRANIPSRYGGRVASVLDVKVRNPYIDKFKLSGGIGLVSTRLTVETPLIKDKLTVVAGVRAGLTDFLLPVFSERLKNTKAKFGDATVKLMYLPTNKDQLTFTGFYSKDFYQLDLITKVQNVNAKSNQYDFGMLNGTLNWQHAFNNKTSLKTILVSSKYTPQIIFPEFGNNNEIRFQSRINYLSLISELKKNVNNEFDYYAGIQVNKYKIEPGNLNPGSADSVLPVSLNSETSYELSGYLNANWSPTDKLSLSAGLRYNHFRLVGPYTLASFDETGETISDTKEFKKGDLVKSYNDFEPRLGLSYKLNKKTSVKASYAIINQYLQNVYNSTTPIPTSRWKMSDTNIKPQRGETYGLGFYHNFREDDKMLTMGLEGYYRDTKNVLSYKPGADFFLQEYLERDVVQGIGKAYGVEFSLKKPKGDVNGWINYTWAKSRLKSYNENLADRVNNNNWYPSDFDRTHVVNATINLEGDKYNTFSFNFTGQTGRPYTVANAVVKVDDLEVPIFIDRNNARLPIYHRLDLSWNVHFSGSKKNKRWKNDWTFTIYNIYSRKNPFNIYYTQRTEERLNRVIFQDSPLGSFQLSALNSPLLSLTYNFTFQ